MSDTAPQTGTETGTQEGTRTGAQPQAQAVAEEREPEPEHDPAAPAPLGVPRTPTGHAEADAHLERLADADHLATDGHLEVYEDVHRGLRDALTALDARPGPQGPVGRPTATPG
ncbi:hypothetical protein ACWGH3_36410 [Streptomyces sp. NPDC054884]|uniref:hypothetical protein n=1 Tax=Streptomyces sp. ME08-AFT2 TaxID=3028683 RepID=UPI0029AB2990|nr:hypothetical protein [Streptomyces sp. ME08-AFT2]MDX3309582.1 hypothetical protein [Streptomyces sp. ME08-AFT2]